MIESARTGSAGRGFDAITLLVYDECQQLTDDQVQMCVDFLSELDFVPVK